MEARGGNGTEKTEIPLSRMLRSIRIAVGKGSVEVRTVGMILWVAWNAAETMTILTLRVLFPGGSGFEDSGKAPGGRARAVLTREQDNEKCCKKFRIKCSGKEPRGGPACGPQTPHSGKKTRGVPREKKCSSPT